PALAKGSARAAYDAPPMNRGYQLDRTSWVKPGNSSWVRIQPPATALRSSTVTDKPRWANKAAQVREFIPLPTMTTSALCASLISTVSARRGQVGETATVKHRRFVFSQGGVAHHTANKQGVVAAFVLTVVLAHKGRYAIVQQWHAFFTIHMRDQRELVLDLGIGKTQGHGHLLLANHIDGKVAAFFKDLQAGRMIHQAPHHQ